MDILLKKYETHFSLSLLKCIHFTLDTKRKQCNFCLWYINGPSFYVLGQAENLNLKNGDYISFPDLLSIYLCIYFIIFKIIMPFLLQKLLFFSLFFLVEFFLLYKCTFFSLLITLNHEII